MFARHSNLLQAVLASPAFSRVSGRRYGSLPLGKLRAGFCEERKDGAPSL
jgi:hypothetical protein